MIEREVAEAIAEELLDRRVRPQLGEDIIVTSVREFATCWVIGYNTRAYAETRAVSHALIGGGPIIINRITGIARTGTSALPVEDQLDRE